MRRALRPCLFLLGALLPRAAAQSLPATGPGFDFFPEGTYDPAVPTPRSVLGYELGEAYTEQWRLARWIEALTGASPRTKLFRYGETYERRPLLLLAVSSPENLARLEEIRADVARLADPRRLRDEAEADAILDRTPAVVWLSFSVHGNEASGTEAAIGLLYQLAAGTDARTREVLASTVALIDPSLNPDGRDRFVSWYRSVAGALPDADPQALEQDEPWPGGRTNHYLFDLNRDWAFLTQVETRGRIAEYLRWMPQVHVDLHEMGAESTYFFFPADVPVNPNFPEATLEWHREFGKGNAEAFDRFGWPYYTAERFDLYYPGYGDSWPSLQGAIGMTYEQAGQSGVRFKREDEQVLTLHDRSWHHFTAALATLETAARRRRALLADFARFHRTALEEGRRGPVREYLWKEGEDPARAYALAALLAAQGIEVERAKGAFVAGPLTKVGGGRIERERFEAGTYLASLAQPRKRLLNALLEPDPSLRDLYFYDVSAWNLPLAFGVEAWFAPARAQVEREPFADRGPIAGPEEMGGEPAVVPREGIYAYLLPWSASGAPPLLHRLLAEGFRASLATRDFRLEGRDWPRGTLVVPARGNGETLPERLGALAGKLRVPVTPVRTGRAERGIDLGSGHVVPLRPRRIAIVAGERVSSGSYGAIRYLLERAYGIAHHVLPLAGLPRARLSEYDAIVLPNGSGYGTVLDEAATERLRDWVRAGGTLVAIGGAAEWASAEGSGLTSVRLVRPEPAPADDGKKAIEWVRLEERERIERRRGIPGAILAIDLDPAHPLAFGSAETSFVMQTSPRAFAHAKDGANTVAAFREDPRVSGFVGEEAGKVLRRAAFLVEVPMARGRVALFADDPSFRAVWHGPTRLFLNSLLLP
ncbi:MAG TPA: M14 family zinc carboxypeptidase [Planctomycetota bacterium]|jgi:hypothetical protein|nr:M14 family zinc carboxypeptidase [Planctomycetota bacterium]